MKEMASDWLSRSMDLLRKATPSKNGSETALSPRSMKNRLEASLRRGEEALPPHILRRLLDSLNAAADERLSEVEAAKHAQSVMDWYATAQPAQRQDLWLLMCEQFGPDEKIIQAARQQLDAADTVQAMGQAQIALRRSLVSGRTRLLQRFSVPAAGMRFLVDLRAQLLAVLKTDKRFIALDAELEYLFSTWFDVAFLELRTLTWDSPASLLEKLIQYEAVHDIRSWDDLKNRVDSDRRCYAFFHPKLPDEPLIFVEVALLDAMSDSITPLLDEKAARADLTKASTAIFYSISNTQAGLRGVSFGNSLIKRVVDSLLAEFPKLRTFATLSPIPGLRSWLLKHGDDLLAQWSPKQHADLAQALVLPAVQQDQEKASSKHVVVKALDLVQAAERALTWPVDTVQHQALMWCAAHYLGHALERGKPADPVARFHLGNGARVERINWAADPSAKGVKQSFGLMVNYRYDLKRLDKHRAMLADGKPPLSSNVKALCKGG